MSVPGRIALGVAVVLALVAGSLVVVPRFGPSATAFSLIDETTLIPLKGTVEVQSAGLTTFTPVTTDTIVRVGDRVRTGPDSYAVVTYFDGSTTTLNPGTEVLLRRLDELPQSGASISFHQEIGLTWNRVEKLIGPESRFETTTATATVFVRGTDFIVRVDANGVTVVEAVTQLVTVEAVIEGVIFTVVVQPGFQTTIEPGQPPSEAAPVAPAAWALLLEVEGPVSFWLTDQNNRSVGFHPQADAFANHIVGSRYTVGSQRLELPDPVSSYELTFKAQGEGGSYSASVTTLRDGQPLASSSVPGLARVLSQGRRVEGSIRPGQGYDRTRLTFDQTTGARFGPLERVEPGDVTGRGAFVSTQLGTAPGFLAEAGVIAVRASATPVLTGADGSPLPTSPASSARGETLTPPLTPEPTSAAEVSPTAFAPAITTATVVEATVGPGEPALVVATPAPSESTSVQSTPTLGALTSVIGEPTAGLPAATLQEATLVLPTATLPEATLVLPTATLPEATLVLPTATLPEATLVLPTATLPEATLVLPTAILPEATLVLPTATLPEATLVLPTATLPEATLVLPTATLPEATLVLPTAILPEATLVLPTATLPEATLVLPTATLPEATLVLPTATLAVPTPTLPLPTVTLP